MYLNKKISNISALLFFVLIPFCSHICYAESTSTEISVKYNDESPGYDQQGNPEAQLTLVTKGIRKVGTQNLITDWNKYYFENETTMLPMDENADVLAICTPSDSMHKAVEMLPDDSNYSGKTIVCEKGEGILITVIAPENPDYEYVADLIVTTSDKGIKRRRVDSVTTMELGSVIIIENSYGKVLIPRNIPHIPI